jgi:hypothetical protein
MRGSGPDQCSESCRVVETLRVNRPAVQHPEGRSFGILLFEDLVDLTDPALITATPDAVDIIGAGEADAATEVHQILSREAPAVFLRLIGEHLATQLIESARPGGDRQSVGRPHRFVSEERPDSILHGDRAGRDLATEQVSRPLLKLLAVRALRILKDHQPAAGALTADDHTPFSGVARRHSSCFHGPILPFPHPGHRLTATGIPELGSGAWTHATALVREGEPETIGCVVVMRPSAARRG